MREELEQAIAEGLSTRQISERIGKSQTSVRHQLKKYNIRTNHKRSVRQYTDTHKTCSKCKQEKLLTEFYVKDKKGTPGSWCKSCMSDSMLQRQRRIKEEALQYRGGKCVSCGFSKHQSALDFHHIDMEQKEFDISINAPALSAHHFTNLFLNRKRCNKFPE